MSELPTLAQAGLTRPSGLIVKDWRGEELPPNVVALVAADSVPAFCSVLEVVVPDQGVWGAGSEVDSLLAQVEV